jgi:hypothetical protein
VHSQNAIEVVEGLDTLRNLEVLDLANNVVKIILLTINLENEVTNVHSNTINKVCKFT